MFLYIKIRKVLPIGIEVRYSIEVCLNTEKRQSMKLKIILTLSICVLVFSWGCAGKTEPPKTETQKEETTAQEDSSDTSKEKKENAAPDFTAEVHDGSSFVLSEQEGNVVLLNFWATWCGPCVGEMPAFERLYQEYEDKEVTILAVNCMEDKSTVDQFVSDSKYTFPIAYDETGEINSLYPTNGIPYTLVIGKDGTVKNAYIGARDAETQYQEYKKAIESALE